MKIKSSMPIASIAATRAPKAARRSDGGAPGKDSVALSDGARALSTVRNAERPPELRTDAVEQVRQQLADGTFEASVDWDSMAGALLAEL